jgi:hypothetical protein
MLLCPEGMPLIFLSTTAAAAWALIVEQRKEKIVTLTLLEALAGDENYRPETNCPKNIWTNRQTRKTSYRQSFLFYF